MIIAAALIEGICFFALIICLFAALNLGAPKQAGQQAETSQAAH